MSGTLLSKSNRIQDAVKYAFQDGDVEEDAADKVKPPTLDVKVIKTDEDSDYLTDRSSIDSKY